MADTAKAVPSKTSKVLSDGQENETPKVKLNDSQVLLQEYQFDAGKKYMFELAVANPEREHPVMESMDGRSFRQSPHKKFKPYQNIVMTSQIVWKGQRRNVRYYDGCDSIFNNEQPTDKELIEQLIKGTNQRAFLDGKFGVHGDEAMLLLYLFVCSWNAESPYRTRTADAIWIPLDKTKVADEDTKRLDMTERALNLAKEATESKMRIHADYLGISLVDFDSGNPLEEKEIRAEYRKFALRHSEDFIKSYGNKALEVKFYIRKALETGLINNKNNPNKAAWKSGTEICDISGLKSQDAIADKLLEFSQTSEGEEFLTQIKAVSEK